MEGDRVGHGLAAIGLGHMLHPPASVRRAVLVREAPPPFVIERSRQIVTKRWLVEKKATLHELADEYGVSAERIRQIEANAFKRMRSQFVA